MCDNTDAVSLCGICRKKSLSFKNPHNLFCIILHTRVMVELSHAYTIAEFSMRVGGTSMHACYITPGTMGIQL